MVGSIWSCSITDWGVVGLTWEWMSCTRETVVRCHERYVNAQTTSGHSPAPAHNNERRRKRERERERERGREALSGKKHPRWRDQAMLS